MRPIAFPETASTVASACLQLPASGSCTSGSLWLWGAAPPYLCTACCYIAGYLEEIVDTRSLVVCRCVWCQLHLAVFCAIQVAKHVSVQRKL
jgi:uncharacterized MAPEG superfamily protein